MQPKKAPSEDNRYFGKVIKKEDDSVRIRWDNADDGGPPEYLDDLIGRESDESKDWWNGEARPTTDRKELKVADDDCGDTEDGRTLRSIKDLGLQVDKLDAEAQKLRGKEKRDKED
eukprot:gene50-17222_t